MRVQVPPPKVGLSALPRKADAIQDWLIVTNRAISALYWWQTKLTIWLNIPQISDETFLQAVQNMAEAGLGDFLDGMSYPVPTLDELRAVLTGLVDPDEEVEL